MAGNIKIGGSFPGGSGGGGGGIGAIVTSHGLSAGGVDGGTLTSNGTIGLDLSVANNGTLAVPHGGTGLSSGLSGGVLTFVGTSTIASSAPLAANHVVIGGGAGLTPATIGGLGTSGQPLLSAGSGNAPAFGPLNLGTSTVITGLLPFANLATLSADSLFGNSGTVGATGSAIAVGANLTLVSGTLTANGTSGTPLTVTDGVNSVTNTGTILVNGGTISGTAGDATITVSGSGGAIGSIVTTGGLTVNGTPGGTLSSSGTIGLEAIAATSLFGNAATIAGTLAAVAVGANLTLTAGGTLNATGGTLVGVGTITAGDNIAVTNPTGPNVTVAVGTIAATSLFGNFGTVAGTMAAVAIGANLSLSAAGTLSATSASGVSAVVAQAGPFLAGGTITSSGTIANSTTSLTAHGILIGEGTGAVVAAAAMTNGQLLIGATSADPAPQTMSGDATINAGGTLALGSIVAGGTVGSVSQIPVITFDTKGRITNATTAAVPVTAANLGAVLNSGTVQVNNNVTLAGTAAGTLSINPGSGTSDVIVNMPSAGGTVTLSYSGTFAYQPFRLHIKQGATAGAIVLNSGTVNGFIFSPTGGPTSFTLTPTPAVIDDLAVLGITTGYALVEAVLQGRTA